MSANIVISGKTYTGIDEISVKDTNNVKTDFILRGFTKSEKDVNFYDYDGTLITAFTAADFANLTSLPINPSHEGLISQGWNWTLADAKSYVASYGKLNIGQMYATASGKTEYDIEVNEATGFTATVNVSGAEKDWGDGTTDTNTSHTYATAGSYTIKLSGSTLPSIYASKKVRAVRISNVVTSIDLGKFQSCYKLKYITMPNTITSIADNAFASCYSLLFAVIPNLVQSIGVSVFATCYSLYSISMPNSITTIGNGVFINCYSLHSIIIPNGITAIGKDLFSGCYSLQFAIIPSTITSVGQTSFANCRSLREFIIPNFMANEESTSIGISSFYQCSSLQSIILPKKVNSIDSNAFASCPWLTIMTVLATTPPTLSATSAIPSSVTKIYIPHGTLTSYQTASNWSNFSSKFVELPA